MQYPHTILVSTVSESTPDTDGNWTEASASPQSFDGRYETNSGSRLVRAMDGTQVVYSGIVYSQFTGDIALGSDVEVKDGAKTIAKGKLINFSQGQLNTRIWL